MKKRLLALGITITMTTGMIFGLTGCDKTEEKTQQGQSKTAEIKVEKDYGLSEEVKDGAILQCFCWSFKTIEESMEDIAMAGYSAIQTSPVNAVYDGGNAGMQLFGEGKWSYIYQPTEWSIGNYQLGTEEEFKSMCATADAYGIKVLIDVVPNHTTPTLDAVSEEFIDAVGGKDKMYHKKGMTEIADYGDRYQCTLEGVGGLPDINTENPKFQDYFLSFINRCIDDGADGFRYDTAKHIGLPDDPKDDDSLENNFWERMTTEVHKADEIFEYGEVLQGTNDRLSDYIDAIGATTASSYGTMLRLCLTSEEFAAEDVEDLNIGDAKPNVVTWVESHDNYCGDDNSYNYSNEDISLGWAVISARAAGTPLFFARPYGTTVEKKWGTLNRIGCAGDYVYKNPTVSAVNHFRNAMKGEGEKFFNPDESNKSIVCIERGDKGIVVVNIGKKDGDVSFETALADGSYVDRVNGTDEYKVESGKLSMKIAGKTAVVLYNEGYKELGKVPVVKVADDVEMNFSEDSISVALNAENVEKSTYKLGSGSETEYKDGDTIEIGKELKSGESVNLILKGENTDGNHTIMTYVFTKKSGTSSGTVVYFMKPDSWNKEVYAYVYDETTGSVVKYNKEWPGEKMKDEGDGKYSYTFTEDWQAPLIIFTDGDNQSNGAMEPGENVIPDNVYEVK